MSALRGFRRTEQAREAAVDVRRWMRHNVWGIVERDESLPKPGERERIGKPYLPPPSRGGRGVGCSYLGYLGENRRGGQLSTLLARRVPGEADGGGTFPGGGGVRWEGDSAMATRGQFQWFGRLNISGPFPAGPII